MAIKTDNGSVWAEYQRGINYQTKMGFATNWAENIRLKEGNMWPAPTEKTKYMPRPVFNQLDFIVENKLSNILGQSLKMIFSPEELPQGDNGEDLSAKIEELNNAAEDMTDMAQNTWNDIDQETLSEECVDDVLTIGTGAFHYYFDNTITGGVFTKYVGKLQGDIIDPMDLFLGNPQLRPTQTQKQPWIIIRTREDVEIIKEKAKENGENYLSITADDKQDNQYDNAKNDIDEANKVTCLTKYYKDKGQIYWTKVTESAVVQKPIPLAPEGAVIPCTLYPVEIVVFKPRKKSVFGRAIIDDIKKNNIAINWGIGMMLLSVQQTAWPKIIAKVGALVQSITNEPGEIITDHNLQQGFDGIKYMQPPNFSTTPVVLAEKILDITRQVTGVTEVNAGEVIGANMAAAAIIALQNQAKKPNERYEKIFARSTKNIGKIWEMFYKTYYNMPRPIQAKDKEGKDITKVFDGSKYAEMGFGLSVDVGPASIFNESLQVSIIEKMYDKGDLDKYGYVKYMPKNTVPSELRQDFKKEAEQIEEQQQTMGQADQIMSQLTPKELQELQNNPALLDEMMQGGQANEMSTMQP